jgi:hypothetical protein
VVVGMILGAAAMLYLARLNVQSAYTSAILPALLLLGAGLGLLFSTSTNSATLGVQPDDAGVASAIVNASQQVGGSVGTALLSTLSASAAAHYLVGSAPTTLVTAQAAVHGYTTAFTWSAVIFAVGALVAAALFRHEAPERGRAAVVAAVH